MPKEIEVNTYDELESKVLECLRDERVCDIYVSAWNRVGASTIVRRVAEAVEKKELIAFDTVIKLLRFTVYGNPREAQRAVAKQLNLEPSIMAKFDEADEDDDFSGVPASSRGMILEVAEEIRWAVKERRVLLLLHNNLADASTVIDFNDLEIPILRRGPNKVLWILGMGFSKIGPFLVASESDALMARANVTISVTDNNEAAVIDCVYAEAVEIARYIIESSGGRLQASPSTVLSCLWYLCFLVLHTGTDQPPQRFVNYLVCESIFQGEEDAACWEFGKAVARMVLPEVGGHALELWKKIITSRILMPLSNGWWWPWQPPKHLIIYRFTDKHTVWILASQEEESYGCMAVKVSPDDPELHNFLDDCRRDLERGTSVLCNVSSIFWKFETKCQALPDSFFELFSNVQVLDLFGCIVSPIYSSFAHLHNLRMLKMEKCRVSGEQSSVNASSLLSAQEGQGGPILFDSLWVLILYNSDADKFLSEGKAFEHMPNLHKFKLEDETFAFPHLGAQKGLGSLRKLRMNCPVHSEGTDEGFFQQMHKLQVFNMSENSHIKFLPKFLSMAINLKKLILDKCKRLESLNLNHLPATIETISLQSCASLQEVVELADPASLPNLKTFRLSESELITKLCLQGCRKLENIDLQELWKLKVFNLSCTAVKTLNFADGKRGISNLPQLKQLYLLGCEQLHRVTLQKEQEPPRLDVLYLDNYRNTCSADRCFDSFQNQREHYAKGISDADGRFFQAHVVVRDVRLFRSLNLAFSDHLDRTKARIHIHVKCSSTTKRGDFTDTATKPGAGITSSTKSSPLIVSNLSTPSYADVLGAVKDHRRQYRPSPPAMPLNNHIEVDGGDHHSLIEEESFRKLMTLAESLFVHENTSALAVNVSMSSLKCLRVENCPNMKFVFTWDKDDNVLVELESMWLSHLRGLNAIFEGGRIVPESYSQLKHIYLEFCSRVKYVLPLLSEPHNLETIDIRYCGDLRAIFIDDDEDIRRMLPKLLSKRPPKLLLKLRSIHLEELPKLQHIYKPNICAPSLQDLTIRGCSRLRKLPLFDQSDSQSRRDVKISCEKDWWDNLERDGSSHFKPKHCPSYKKPMRARWL